MVRGGFIFSLSQVYRGGKTLLFSNTGLVSFSAPVSGASPARANGTEKIKTIDTTAETSTEFIFFLQTE
jgi:hypothetical protein